MNRYKYDECTILKPDIVIVQCRARRTIFEYKAYDSEQTNKHGRVMLCFARLEFKVYQGQPFLN
jgi:hypothetical protein